MADLRIIGQTVNKGRGGNAVPTDVKGTRDGAIYVADYIQALAMEGRIFHQGIGTLTTPTTFRVGITTLQPELVIDVPTGTTIIPVEISIHLETAAGTISEFVAMTGTALRGAGTSTAGAPLSTRTDRAVASSCSAYYTYTGNAAAMTGTVEFWRGGFTFAYATGEGGPLLHYTYDVRKNTPQVIVGPGNLSLYIGGTGTAPTGYVVCSWAELPSAGI